MSTQSIEVRHGETFEVALREPATSGYRWHSAETAAEISLVEERYEPPAAGPIGSPGRRIVTLRATRKGRYRLKFVLTRPWEAQAEAEHYVEVVAF